jgi:hypothetical protein
MLDVVVQSAVLAVPEGRLIFSAEELHQPEGGWGRVGAVASASVCEACILLTMHTL